MSQEEEIFQTSEEHEGQESGDEARGELSLDELQARLEEVERERSQFRGMAQRAQADLMNYRQRVEKEREDAHRNMVERGMRNLLPIIDDLSLAIQHTPHNTEEASWFEGVRLIERRLHALLELECVTEMDAEGQPFDPWQHEALFMIDTLDDEPGIVVDVIRPGYKIQDRVLRTAQVSVTQTLQPKGNESFTQSEETESNREEKEEQ